MLPPPIVVFLVIARNNSSLEFIFMILSTKKSGSTTILPEKLNSDSFSNITSMPNASIFIKTFQLSGMKRYVEND
jgi:hypothetical protein